MASTTEVTATPRIVFSYPLLKRTERCGLNPSPQLEKQTRVILLFRFACTARRSKATALHLSNISSMGDTD